MKQPKHAIAVRTLAALAALAALAIAGAGCVQESGPSLSDRVETRDGNGNLTVAFAAGSLVIPMDTASQDSGTLLAYGLVDALLRAGVQVDVVIAAGKSAGGNDLTGAAGHLFANSASTFTNKSYSAAPFVVDSSQAAAATPIITSFQAAHAAVEVDVLTASLSGTVQRTLSASPRVAIEAAGYELTAFNYLNAAAIPDSSGLPWPTAKAASYTSRDVVTSAQIAGPTTGGTVDGALFNADQSPAFCALAVTHDDSETNESVREVRQFLTAQPTQAIFGCTAITTYENNATNGHFLSTLGVVDDSGISADLNVLSLAGISLDANTGNVLLPIAGQLGTAGPPTAVNLANPSSPFTQWSATFTPASGTVESLSPATNSAYKGTPILLQGTNFINVNTNAANAKIVMLSGPLDGTASNGRVTYLTGHDYGETLPISTHASTNGARMFLENLYQAPCTASAGQASIVVSASTATAMPSKLSSFTYTVSAVNSGSGPATSSVLSISLPTGVSFTSATGSGSNASGVVSWPATSIAAGATLSYSVTVSVNADGSYSLAPRAAFTSGNSSRSVTGTAVVLTRDTVAPNASITSKPANPTNQTSATFVFAAGEPSTYVCALDGAAASACTSPITYSPLSSASHTFSVLATDLAGNVQDGATTYSWTIDTTAPVTKITSGPANPTNVQSATFAFTSTKLSSTFTCSLDGAAAAGCTSPMSYAGPIAAGAHSFKVIATDNAGNVDPTGATDAWTIDRTPPVASITSAPQSITSSSSATVAFTSSKASSTFQCKLDTAGYATCASPSTFTVSTGSHTFSVNAIDPAGNTSVSPASTTWVVDSTSPSTSILTGPLSPTNQTQATFTYTSTKTGATFACSLDGAAFTACASALSQSYSGLAAGQHVFSVRSTDSAGNVDPTPPSWTWTIELTPPDTTITSAPPAITNQTSATLAFTSSEALSSFSCSLDGAAYAACTSPLTITVAAGTHTFDVYATDAAGNVDPTPASVSWVVNLIGPTTSFTQTPVNPTNQTSATFAFTSSESGSTFQCALDSAALAACQSPVTIAGPLSAGAHTFNVVATDPAGNVQVPPATFSWTIDLTAPTVTISSAPASDTNQTSATFAFSSNESGATFKCSLDSTGYAACTSPITYPSLAPGNHVFSVEASDLAGNTSNPATFAWTIDTTAPTVIFTSGPSTPTNKTGATFAFTSSKSGSTFQCSLDGAAYATCASPVAEGPLSAGAHTFDVEAIDEAGNISAPAAYPWTIDLTPPVTTITQKPASVDSHTSATFAFTASEQATFVCTLDSGAAAACTSPVTYSPLAAGSHTFTVQATDLAGNTEVTPPSYMWTIDTALPQTIIDSGPANPTKATSATFAFHSSAPSPTFQCWVDAGAHAACTSPTTFTSLAQGAHTFYVQATDAAGNVEPNPAQYGWTIDLTPPTTTITSAPPSLTNSTSATIVFASSEQSSTFTCSLDSAAASACTSPTNLSGLSASQHSFTVHATDAAGNTDPTGATATWTVDTTLPTTTIAADVTSPTKRTSADFTLTASEANSTFQCKLDAQGWTACNSPDTVTGLADGAHTFTARATDAAGNVGPAATGFDWTVDTVSPTTTLSPVASPTNQTSETFTFSSSESGSTFTCALDGAAASACTSPLAVSGLSAGNHTFAVHATDAAGNTDATGASATWTINLTAPTVTFRSGPRSPTNQTQATLAFSADEAGSTLACKLDSGTYAACTSPMTYSGLSQASHAMLVVATDAAGNVSAPAEYDWTVDLTPPDTQLFGAPPAYTNETTANLTFTSTKSGGGFTCSVDGSAAAACQSPVALANLADGQHTFAVAAFDAAGNVDPTPASAQWTVDTLLPVTTITSAPPATTTSSSAAIAFTVNKQTFTEACTIDGAAASACTSPVQLTALGLGGHQVTLQATDNAGNVEAQPKVVSWTIAPMSIADGGSQMDGGTSDGGGGLDGGTINDGGSTATDGGGELDGGTISDAGSTTTDGGSELDGGTSSDAGSTTTDGGSELDGGTTTDGGGTATDGGSGTDGGTISDGGGTMTDGGSGTDGGTMSDDGGTIGDGGSETDGGAIGDGGGTISDGGSTSGDGGGSTGNSDAGQTNPGPNNGYQFAGGGCTQAPMSTLLPIFGMLALLKRRKKSRLNR